MVIHMTTNKDTKPEATAPTTEAPKAEWDQAEFTRLFARVKAEVSTIVQDANKKRPLFSANQESAVAKRGAVLKALESFIEMVDNAKREA